MEGEEGSGASCSASAAAAAAAEQQVRVVRCPKCEKFLPELPNYSVYVCGGCGTTLQAKKHSAPETTCLDKTDVVHVKYLEVLESSPEKKEPVSEANFETISEENSQRVQATPEERLVTQRMMPEHRDSRCSSGDDQIPREPSSLMFEATLRDDGTETEIREAKYRRIRNEEKGEVKQPVRPSDRSRISVVDTIPPNAYLGEHQMKSSFGDANGSQRADGRNMDGPSSVSGLEKDRAELLRMLDELRDQVQRSCEITEKPSVGASTSRVADASSSYSPHELLSRLRHGSPQLQRNGSQCSPSLSGQNPGVPHTYASVPTHQDLHGYREPATHMGAPCYPVGQYPWRNCDSYFFGQHNHDPLVSYHHGGFYHQPACSCLHCHHREFLPVQGAPVGFNHHRVPYPGAYPVNGSVMFGMQNNNSRGINASIHRGHMRGNLSKKPPQTCEPIACGAPFTICYNCYEVLQLPKKCPLPGKDEYKLRCGSCSHVIVVKLDGSRLDVSAPSPISHMSAASRNNSSDVQGSNAYSATDERLLPLYSFSAGSHCSRERDLQSNSSDTEKVQGISSSSSIFEDENNPARSNSQRGTPRSSDLPVEAQVVSRVPSLPLHHHFAHSPSERVVNGSGKGSRSTRSEHEKTVLTETCRHNTVKDVRVVSVMSLSDDEYEDPDCSQDPGVGAQHVDRSIATKTGDSFFTNLMKKSFKINNGMGNGRAKVFINGYPISDRAVKKAEKIAGPIYPGEYWYDYRAGFWGVMGQSCLGMIPPYIPQLNYPMPKNCAGGNTGIFINGRELHQKDFDLLVGRGLSESPDRSYKVEMSGKVYDEVSGEELYCLGKLAPTVEKMKRGFGMRPPRTIR
ncbi:protein ENHANCED DISEASE RESISTANCE 4-like [Triticum dicoccoides]|uniref:protein ENHANCED DISEASE RESISTANCE 4-like n=1 Tax=Triticum dicoccoides TaxID=85692 RepID=UPI000E7A05A7|nr:protein ENHANCED DISEASE RESISTANCE 4-like [Triticum dicoccoides]